VSTVSLDATFSVALLLGAQTAQGAFPASTIHEVYQYAWLRDGSWCAYALDGAGNVHAADAWHEWVATTLVAHADRVREATVAALAGNPNPRVMLPARFTLSGEEEPPAPEEWPNFQTDCYGFWLWAAADHVNRGGVLNDTLAEAVGLVIQYLLAVGHQPCYDCWEEHPGHRHTSSLAAVAAGLRDAGSLVGIFAASTRSEELLQLITGPEHTLAGGLVRYPGDTRVDGSLLWLGPPFNLLPVTGDLYRTTYQRVVDELYRPGGGVRRYLGDTFYGGSQWILLAASLGWAALQLGDRGLADDLLAWIESAATDQGYLPEQVASNVQSAHMLAYWQDHWGSTATPLLWSHAMHLVLLDELRRAGQ
jgi:GH15 family glucan-1,4-alpha-glucosidase